MNQNFENILKGLKDPKKLEATKKILSTYEEQNAIDAKFYRKPDKIKECSDKLFDVIRTSDKFLEALIKIEASTPYSIFSYIINEEFSDVMFHANGYNLTDNKKVVKAIIPDELLDIYHVFIDHFVNNIKFLANKKFDTGNAILDTEISKIRFNLIHNTLNVYERPVIVLRKQTVVNNDNSFFESDEYIKSVCSSQNQINAIQKYSQKGNIIVYGETGSGKTTMLKYIGNYNLKEKRNLCTIEDTKELNINVPIALLTNHHYKIKDLFIASLRQHPSHVMVGETRTDEIVDILESALTTNVATSIHANSFARAIQRIVFMSMARNVTSSQIIDLINASVDCFIFMENRKVKEIWVHKTDFGKDIYNSYEQIK